MPKPLLLINPRSGRGGPSPDELRYEARRLGIDARIVEPQDDPADVARAADADAIGIAGGDGSLAPIVTVALERDIPFVCVPYGTRNHFARDAGLDRNDALAALAAFAGEERRVDVGRVDGRVFVNNVSLGLYARLVHRRERHRRRREALARLRALWILVRHPRPASVIVDGEPVEARVVLVANNSYETGLLSPGERTSLDGGELHLYTTRRVFRSGWQERAGPRFLIDAPQNHLRAAVDGEPALLETPSTFEIEPRALRLLVPPAP